ncbi:MAG: peptidylprolyl isomerase [Gammaproteobacteria bacterium]
MALALQAQPAIVELDRIVAVVNEDVITLSELDTYLDTVKKQLAQRNTQLPPDDVLQRQVLERMIQERLQLQLAQRQGIRVDDETINNVIANIARQNRLDLNQFRELLTREGFDFSAFRSNIQNEIIIARLQKKLVESQINVTEQEVDTYLARQKSAGNTNEHYHLGHILIALPEAASPEQIEQVRARATDVLNKLRSVADFAQTAAAVSAGQEALKGGDLGWLEAGQVPTIFEEALETLAINQVSDLIRSPSGFHIIKLLDKKTTEQKHIVQQTLARHILITTNEVVSDADARQRLQRLRERLLAGEDFATLSQANSDDKAAAANGGSLGWVNPGVMVPEFQEVMDTLAPGELSQPFQSRFGWHLVQVMSRRQHDDTEQYTRTRARQSLGERKLSEATQNWLRRLRDESYVEYRLER